MSDSPIFDQLIAERFGTEEKYRERIAPSNYVEPTWTPWMPKAAVQSEPATNPDVITKKPQTPFKPERGDTMEIPRVRPLSEKNVA